MKDIRRKLHPRGRAKIQTTDGINILSMQQKEESGKPDNNTNKSLTSGKDVVNNNQRKWISGSSSNLTEEFCHTKRQTVYNSSSVHPERKIGKPNRDTEKVLTSKRDVGSYYQAREVNEGGRISGRSPTLVEESHQVKMQTSDDSNIPSMQQKEEDGKPNTNATTDLTSEENGVSSHQGKRISGSDSTLEEEYSHVNNPSMKQKEASGSHNNSSNLTSEKDVIISYQGERVSGSDSTFKEESHHVKRQTIYNSSSRHSGKESGKPKRDLNTVLISDKDIENSHQTGRRLDKDSILMEESRQVKMQTTCISNSSSTHPERETSRPETRKRW